MIYHLKILLILASLTIVSQIAYAKSDQSQYQRPKKFYDLYKRKVVTYTKPLVEAKKAPRRVFASYEAPQIPKKRTLPTVKHVRYVLPPLPKYRPKKYIYDMDSRQVVGYTYKKVLPTQVTLKKSTQSNGLSMQLRRSIGSESTSSPQRTASSRDSHRKEISSRALKDKDIIRLEDIK